jgi:hypothetical protein
VLLKFGAAACWQALVLALAAVLLGAAVAQAAPTFLSPIDVSDAGQDAYGVQVEEDSSGNSLMVWARFDGTNFRIQAKLRAPDGTSGPTATVSQSGRDALDPQVAFDPNGNAIAVWTQYDGSSGRVHAAFRPAGGSFGGDQTISSGGQTAIAPQISIDSTGKAIAVWYRFDGTTDRVQAAVRPANGSFGAAQNLSMPGVEAYEPMVAAGPNADTNGVAAWTGSDGTNLRVQSSRRRDVVGYPRPAGAGPLRASLVPAYNPCAPGSANRTHGPPLAHPSCNPPSRNSGVLTIGTPDSNGFAANSLSSVKFKVTTGNAGTEANEADVNAVIKIDDVRNHPSGTDYTGRIGINVNLQITDHRNAAEQPEHGTVQTFPLAWSVQCVATIETTRGSACSTITSLNAILPGAVLETKRTIWEMGQVTVRDAGPNGTGYAACPPTCGDGDETTFMRQGIFIP